MKRLHLFKRSIGMRVYRSGLRRALRSLVCVGLLACIACAHAAYPDRPVTLILPFPPTGSTDIEGLPRINKLTRIMQNMSAPGLTDMMVNHIEQTLTAALGQPVHALRRARGHTGLGVRYVAQSAADGYTLLFADAPTLMVFPALDSAPRADPLTELTPVGLFARMPIALVASTDHPPQTVGQLVERARRLPSSINFASAGEGSTSHLAGELFALTTAARIVHVNYNGSLPALNAVVTGQVELGFVPLPAVLPFIGGGKIRLIAIASAQRHPAAPNVPTVSESGVPGLVADGWFGVFAPSRTPANIVSLLNFDLNRALGEDYLRRSLLGQGLVPAPGSSEQLRMQVETDSTRWRSILKRSPAAP